MQKEGGAEKSSEDLVVHKLSEVLGLQRRVRHNLLEVEDAQAERARLADELEQVQGNLSEEERADLLGSGKSFQDWVDDMNQDWERILAGERSYDKIDMEKEKEQLEES